MALGEESSRTEEERSVGGYAGDDDSCGYVVSGGRGIPSVQ
jgi:hypothetical protein